MYVHVLLCVYACHMYMEIRSVLPRSDSRSSGGLSVPERAEALCETLHADYVHSIAHSKKELKIVGHCNFVKRCLYILYIHVFAGSC